jgi:predicted nuclease of predicted toxin-antitoxin system
MNLKFLADESCDFAVVRCLRAAGFDVEAIMEIASGESDANIIKMAVASGRILITEDRDFGDLVYAHQQEHGGITLIRYPSTARKNMAEVIRDLVLQKGETLAGCFMVVSPHKIGIRNKI